MSEPRKLNTGETQRTVYHAGQSAPRSLHTAGAATGQQQYEEARRAAREAAAQGGRRTRGFQRVQPQDVNRYQAAQSAGQSAPRTVNTGARTLHTNGSGAQHAAAQPAARTIRRADAAAQSAAQPQLTPAQRQAQALQRQAAARQNAAAARPRVQHLDLSRAQGERAAYDFDSEDAAFAARRPAAPAGQAPARPAAPARKSAAPARGGAGGGKPPRGPGKGKKGRGEGSGKGKRGKGKRKAAWWKVLLGTLLALVVIFGGTFAVIMHALRPTIGNASLSELINTPKGLEGQQLNILVLGIDRSAEGGEMHAGTVSDSQSNDGNTDMIMYVQLDFVNNEVRMLQIPRNIIVSSDKSVANNYQINSVAITQGSDGNNNYGALRELIYDQFGLYTDGVVAIRLEALVELVDTLGPIQVYVPQEITYRDDDGNVTSHLDQGLQWMDGTTAEFFLRARKSYGLSDIARLDAQRYFYSAMFARLRAMTVWDIARILPVCLNYMETDLKISDLVSAAVSLLNVSSDHIMMCKIPVYMGGIMYQGQDVVVVERQGAADLLNTYFRTPETQVPAENLNVCDDLLDVSGYSPTDTNVQYMGGLNEEVVSAAGQSGTEIDPNAEYDLPAATPAPEAGADSSAAGSEADPAA